MKLLGKKAFVTGASRGIGRAIAYELAKEGASVAIGYFKNSEQAEELAKELNTFSQECFPVQVDVRSRESIKKALSLITERFILLDILVNNAGINKPNDFDKITDEEWNEVLSVNLHGAFMVSQESLPIMNIGGSIINISSVSGQYGGPRTTHYAVSKAGLISLTQNMAIFCAPKIRVNAVAPGLIESEMAAAAKNLNIKDKILLQRLGTKEEVAKTVVFLASDDSSYITAQTINVNGGLYF